MHNSKCFQTAKATEILWECVVNPKEGWEKVWRAFECWEFEKFGLKCYYCFKITMIFYYRKIHYNAHADTSMPNICYFLDSIISIRIKSIISNFLGIFPILFPSQFYIRPLSPTSIFAPVVHSPLAPAYLWAEHSVKARERPMGEQRGVYDEDFDAHIASL